MNTTTINKDHIEYVKKLANLHLRPGVEFDDLVQDGTIGLMIAYKKYDPSKGSSFKTYSSYWIQRYMYRTTGSSTYTDIDDLELGTGDDCETVEFHKFLYEVINTLLTCVECDIIAKRFGLFGNKIHTLRDISVLKGYSYTKTHNHYKSALRKIKEAYRVKGYTY